MSTTVVERPVLTDHEIHRRVIAELKYDTLIDETDVGVQVDTGVVTLTGTVKSLAEKNAALKAVHRVIGVLDVANDIEVKPPMDWRRTDTDIAHDARHALEMDVLVPHDRVRTTVAGGWITLEGTVDTVAQRDVCERAVSHLPGVRGVTNTITVKPAAAKPESVRCAILETLARQAAHEAENIKVDVKDGRVVLTGTVHSWFERRAILNAAGQAAGVEQVVDHLHTNPYAV